MRCKRRNLLAAGLGALALPVARAQSWPTKAVRLVVPFAPGGSSEIVARSLAAELTKTLGQTVFIENKPAQPATSPCRRWRNRCPTDTR